MKCVKLIHDRMPVTAYFRSCVGPFALINFELDRNDSEAGAYR